MTLNEAAKKWGMSPNWVRILVKSGRVPSVLRKDGPVAYYDIPEGTPKPPSMQRAPRRLGTGPEVLEASVKRREYRAKMKKAAKLKKAAKAKAKPKK